MGKAGNHSVMRARVAKEATKQYKEAIDNYIQKGLEVVAFGIVRSAVRLRLTNNKAHNYTGNLINSIVAAVFHKGNLAYTRFSYEDPTTGKEPIQIEMTASKGVYHFKKDWDNAESNYKPELETDEYDGIKHAMDFISLYSSKSNYFEIVVAYTTEYAPFVEEAHRSLGFEMALKDFNGYMLRMVEVMSTGKAWNGAVLKKVNVTANS